MVEPSLLEQVLQLPAEDRRELMDEISGSLAAEEPLSPELQSLLDERLADAAANPNAHRPWEDVKREIFGQYLS